MTSPLQFPNIQPGPVINDPGMGGAIASALAQVLAAQQQQREQQWRQQQLEHQWAMEQANLQVSQGNLAVNQQQLSAQTTQAAAKSAAEGQVGGVMIRALGGGQAQPTQPSIPQQRGNFTQDPGQGVFKQVLSGGAQAAQAAPDIFAGVLPENMPAAVEGVGKVRELSKPLTPPTTDMQNYASWASLAGVNPSDPRALEFYKTMIGPKPNQVTVNNNGEKAFGKAYNEKQAGQLADAEDIARKSARASAGLSEAYGLVGKSYTGFGANQKLALSRMAIALGADPNLTRTADTQTLLKLSGDQVLALMSTRVLGSNNAISDSDLRFANAQSGRDITAEPSTLKKTYRINMGTGMMMQQDAADQLREQAQYVDPSMTKQLLAKAKGIDQRLGKQWVRYAGMLQDEGETADQIIERMPAPFRQQYGFQVRQLYERQQADLQKRLKKSGLVLPGQP